MLSQRTKVFIAALITTAIVASCGGSDSSSRQRNVAMDGKQQCLSDEDTKIDTKGKAVLTFCTTATTFKTLDENGEVLSESKDIAANHTAQFEPAAGQNTVRILSFNSKGIQVGEDVVTTILPDCSTGAACAVGDTGPGGGIVVYDAGSKQSWGQYIEMARKGWHDNLGGEVAGSFGCEDKNLETIPDLGSGKVNTDKFVNDCEATAAYGQRAYTLVANYKSGVDSSIDDWAIPSAWDLYEIDSMSADVWKKLELSGTYSSSTETSYARAQMTVYRYGETQNPRQRYYGPDFSTTRKSISNNFMVRPVRYFSASGEVKPSIKVVGVMDIPTTTTEVTTTTETPETTTLAPNTLPAPLGGNVVINDETGYISVSWNEPYPFDTSHDFNIVWEKAAGSRGGGGGVRANQPDVKIPIKRFVQDTEYLFKIGRIGDNQTFWGEEFSAIPNQSKIIDSPTSTAYTNTTSTIEETVTTSVEAPTPTPAPTNEVPTPTAVQTTNSPISTTVNKLDCTVAPKVSLSSQDPTSNDKITFTVTHPCFGLYENQWVFFGRAETDAENMTYMSRNTSTGVEGKSWTGSAQLDPGVHKFLFKVHFLVDNDIVVSDLRQVDVTVTEGSTPSNNSCNNDNITLEKSKLIVTCPSIWSQAIVESGTFRGLITEIDDTKLTSDLSDIGSGWHQLEVVVNYGLEFFQTQVTVCIKSCELPTSFEPFTVSLDKDDVTVTAPSVCASGLSISQMYQATENLYKQSDSETSYSVEPTSFALNGSTGALFITREDCENGGMLTAFASLGRTATPPTPEDVAPPVDDAVTTIGLPEITGGATDLPVGEVTGGTVMASTAATSVVLTPDVVTGLLDLTVEGSKVELVEVSLDGITWQNALLGSFAMPSTAETMSVRLTAASGKQTVIKQSIDRSVPVVVSQNDEVVSTTADSSSSGSGILSYWWVLVLLVLVGGFFATKKKRAA
jgi:hypothetical protein